VKYHPKHAEQLTDLNKLYSVASCWIIIAILQDALSTECKILSALFLYRLFLPRIKLDIVVLEIIT